MTASGGTVALNGRTSAPQLPMSDPVDPLERIIGELEEQLAPIAAERSQLEARIAELLRQENRIKAGISALKSGAPKKPAAARPTRDSHDWTPAQHTQDEVYAAFATAGEPLTIRQAADLCPSLSPSTVKKSVEALRAAERLRLMGTAPTPGSPKLYGVMA